MHRQSVVPAAVCVTFCLRSNPSLSGRLEEVRRSFEADRQQFLTPLCKWLLMKYQPYANPHLCHPYLVWQPVLTLSSLSPVDHGQLRQAAELGERYEDFRVLVRLCEETGNREQLREYMARFSAQVPPAIPLFLLLHPAFSMHEGERGV